MEFWGDAGPGLFERHPAIAGLMRRSVGAGIELATAPTRGIAIRKTRTESFRTRVNMGVTMCAPGNEVEPDCRPVGRKQCEKRKVKSERYGGLLVSSLDLR
jgi:hypothetical protein